MLQIKIFSVNYEDDVFELEGAINKFIRDINSRVTSILVLSPTSILVIYKVRRSKQ
jgi:hypothetical protein